MSSNNWIAALALAALPLGALAAPLLTTTHATGQLVTYDNTFYEFGAGLQPGASVGLDFQSEDSPADGTMGAGTLTMTGQIFWTFGVTVGGVNLSLPSWSGNMYQMQLQNDVHNAAGALVDAFDLRVTVRGSINSYAMSEHLEFAPDTFGDLDAWSILALSDARLLGGTIDLNRISERYDATFIISNLHADVGGFSAQFSGPGAEVPAVPEPGQSALLLAGLAAIAALRHRPRRPRRR